MWKRNQRLQNSDPGAGGGGGTPPPATWYGSDANKALVESKGFKTVDDVFTWGTNAEKLIGADRAGRTVVLPKDANDAEGIKAYRTKIGVPESADKYELPVPDGQEAGFAKVAAGWFHEQGVPKEAAQKIAGQWNGYLEKLIKDSDTELQNASNAELGKVKGEWGADFDKNAEFAKRFMREAGWSDDKIARYEQAFGTADMLKTFHSLGSKLGEHGFSGSDGKGGGGVTPQQAATQIEELKAKRVANQISQADYFKEMETLGPIAARLQQGA